MRRIARPLEVDRRIVRRRRNAVQRLLQQDLAPAQFERNHCLLRQCLQLLALQVAQVTRHAVDHHQRSERMAARCNQRVGAIEADMRRPGDQPIVDETRIPQRIAHLEVTRMLDRMLAKR